jgi:hypothetical protein
MYVSRSSSATDRSHQSSRLSHSLLSSSGAVSKRAYHPISSDNNSRQYRGNTVQLALALARLFAPGNTDFSFHMPDRQALTSLITFLLGASLGRIGDKIGAKTRLWLTLGTFLQALMTMAAALCIWKGNQTSYAGDRGDPSWTNPLGFAGLGFASASIGLQGIMGKRVNSQFATTGMLIFHSKMAGTDQSD